VKLSNVGLAAGSDEARARVLTRAFPALGVFEMLFGGDAAKARELTVLAL
jgi:hypothetical protein